MLKSKKNFIHNFLFISQLDATTKKRLKNIAQRLLLIQKKVVILAEVIQTRHHNNTSSLTYVSIYQ
jgi:hypothetical protein